MSLVEIRLSAAGLDCCRASADRDKPYEFLMMKVNPRKFK